MVALHLAGFDWIEIKALHNIARTYSGDEGARRLRVQEYDESMI